MSVSFKFKNDLKHHTVPCDGLNISLRDLKRGIIRHNKLGKVTDFDLIITKDEDGRVYSNESELIPKNTTVTVQRSPLPDGKKKVWEEDPLGNLVTTTGSVKYSALAPLNVSAMLQLNSGKGSEEDKLENMMVNSTEMYREKNWTKFKGQKSLPEGSRPPPSWKCNKCAQNHWISECPFQASEMKRTTGIPRSFLQPAAEENVLGAKISPQGLIVVNEMEQAAYSEVKVERSPWVADDRPSAPKIKIPDDLVCPLCKDILNDAVMTSCCAEAACDECARDGIISSDGSKCPICQASISPEELIPYRMYRDKVDKFQNQTGYTKLKKISAAPAKASSLDLPFTGLSVSLPDIVLPDPKDAQFASIMNQKGTETIKAPNLDFTLVPQASTRGQIILPQLFSQQELFAPISLSSTTSPNLNSSQDSAQEEGGPTSLPAVDIPASPSQPSHSSTKPQSPTSPTRQGRRSVSPARYVGKSPSPSRQAGKSGSPPRNGGNSLSPSRHARKSTSPSKQRGRSTSPAKHGGGGHRQQSPVRSSRNGSNVATGSPGRGHHGEPPSPGRQPLAHSPTKHPATRDRGRSPRRDISPQHLRRSERPPSPHRREERSERLLEPRPEGRAQSPDRRGYTRGGSPRRSGSPKQRTDFFLLGHAPSMDRRSDAPGPGMDRRSDVPGPGMDRRSDVPGLGMDRRSDVPGPGMDRRMEVPGGDIIDTTVPPPAFPVPINLPVGVPLPPGAMMVPQQSFPPPYLSPGSASDPLSAFLAAMAQLDRRRNRSPARRSPPRAYRERERRPRSRSRERYRSTEYSKYKGGGVRSSPDRYRFKQRGSSPPLTRSGEPHPRSPEQGRRHSQLPVEDGLEDQDPRRYDSLARRSEDRRIEEVPPQRVIDDRRYDDRRSVEAARRPDDQRMDEHTRRTHDSRRMDEQSRRGLEEQSTRRDIRGLEEPSTRRDTRGLEEPSTRRGLEDSSARRVYDEYSRVRKTTKYDELSETVRQEKHDQKTYSRDYKRYERDERERRTDYRKHKVEPHSSRSDRPNDDARSMSLSLSPPQERSGSRGGDEVVYEDDILEERERLSRGKVDSEEKEKKKSKKKKKNREEEDSDDDSKKKKRSKKKKDKKKKEEEAEKKLEKEEEMENTVTPLVSYDSQEEDKEVSKAATPESVQKTLPEEEEPKPGDEVAKPPPAEEPPNKAEENKKFRHTFKSSFSEIQEVKPSVILPTLVFNQKTSELSVKESTQPKGQELPLASKPPKTKHGRGSESSRHSHQSSKKSAGDETADGKVPEDGHKEALVDVTDIVALGDPNTADGGEMKPVHGVQSHGDVTKTAVHAGETQTSVRRRREQSAERRERSPGTRGHSPVKRDLSPVMSPQPSPLRTTDLLKTQEYFEPDNPLVHNEMDPGFKTEIEAFKSQLQQAKKLNKEDDTRLKVAEPDSTIDSTQLDIGWNQEVPGAPLDKSVDQPQTLLIKALNNIRDNEKPKRRRRMSSGTQEAEGGVEKKKKKKKKRKESQSEEENTEAKEEKKDGSEEESGDEKKKKRKKEGKKKKKKKSKKVDAKTLKKLMKLKTMSKEELLEMVNKSKKKKKKKKKGDDEDADSDVESPKSSSKERKKKRRSDEEEPENRSASRHRSMSSRRSLKDRRSPSYSKSRIRSRSPPGAVRTRSTSIEETGRRRQPIKEREVKSVRERLGTRDEVAQEEERQVKITGTNFQIRLENRVGTTGSTEREKGRLSSVVQKRINERERSRSRSRDHGSGRDRGVGRYRRH